MSGQLSLFDSPSSPHTVPPVAAASVAAPEASEERPALVMGPVAETPRAAKPSGGVGKVREWPVSPSNSSNRKWFGFRDEDGHPLLRVLYLTDHSQGEMRLAIPATGEVFEGGRSRAWCPFYRRIIELAREQGLQGWASEFLTCSWQGEERPFVWGAE